MPSAASLKYYLATRHGGDGDEDDPYAPTAEQMAALPEPWMQQTKYSRRVSYILIAMLVVAMLFGAINSLRRRSSVGKRMINLPGYRHIASGLRVLSYRRTPTFSPFFESRSVGSLIIIFSFCIATIVWCFSITPYYRPNAEWGSPPLAIRAGMMANAMIPWLFALALKVNPITILAHISHERLQIYHQWLARLIVFFGFVHTIPFLWQPNHDEAPGTLSEVWHSKENYTTYWTGTVALAIMFWMCLSSFGWARKLSYQTFVIQHILCTIAFLAFYFVHCQDLLNSWLWLWATVGVWALSTLLKWTRMAASSNFFVQFKATVEAEVVSEGKVEEDDERIIRLALRTPVRWSPGQHAFIRFPTLGPFQSHPFTICSLPSPTRDTESIMVMTARCHRGMTQRLFNTVEQERQLASAHAQDNEKSQLSDSHSSEMEKQSNSSSDSSSQPPKSFQTGAIALPAVIDGPYGESTHLQSYDEALLIAGGIGITHCLPLILDVATTTPADLARSGLKRIHLVWTLRSDGLVAWFQPQLDAAVDALKLLGVEFVVDVHLTRQQPQDQQERQGSTSPLDTDRQYVRPNVPELVHTTVEQAAATDSVQSLHIIVCGPRSLNRECANAVSRQNARLFMGRLGAGQEGLKEIVLSDECFGY